MKNPLKITLTLLTAIVMSVGILKPEILNGTPASPAVGNWYQQFMPDLGNRQINDVIFVDSLTGYSTAYSNTDTNYILKTTNGGNNWSIVYRNFALSNRVQFLNQTVGFVCGGALIKTINGGMNWVNVNTSGIAPENMYVLNEDSIWIIDSETLLGGVFFTSNGGINWVQQLNAGGSNPDRIYMYNARIGFVSRLQNNCCLYKTTNSGLNWISVPGETAFNEMYFIDSLTGWKSPPMKKTTNGGLNWISQVLPQGGNLVPNGNTFTVLNKDTLWVSGGYKLFPGQGPRGTLNFTTNGGDTWYFQLLDTSYQIPNILYVDFVNKRNGWAYLGPQGVHTTNGGDTVFYLGLVQTSSNIPKDFELKQNYPNPFNPRTVIPYKLKKSAFVRLIAYEVTGKETQIMVDQHQQPGEYEVDFIGKFAVSSGVYFYRIEVTDDRSKQLFTETKKMVLLK